MEPDDDLGVLASTLGTAPMTDRVPMVRYREDGTARRRRGRAGLPRLPVVSDGVSLPVPSDVLEDWIRAPYRVGDAEARRAVVAVATCA